MDQETENQRIPDDVLDGRVGAGFSKFLSLELSCEVADCDWRWVHDGDDRSVRCHSCNSGYPWLDTYYLWRIYSLSEKHAAMTNAGRDG